MADQRITQQYIAAQLCISQERVDAVIYNDLQMTKGFCQMGPKISESRPETSPAQHVQGKLCDV